MKTRQAGYILIFILSVSTLSNFVNQSDGYLILSSFTLSFSAYYLLLNNREYSFTTFIVIGFLARLICFFSLPTLSDDFYRFLWDGFLLNQGISPYQSIPSDIAVQSVYGEVLSSSMNSSDYFSVYPPFLQYIFGLAQWLGGESIFQGVLFLRLIYLFAEITTLYLGVEILKKLKIPYSHILWYWLNPLVIVEIIGNVHPEGLVIPFLFAAILCFIHFSPIISGVSWGIAFAIKLNPLLIFLPFLKSASKIMHLLLGFLIPVVISLLSVWNLQSISAIWNSIDLYFRSFEFNASIYYVVRELGIWITGYNQIALIGPILGIIFTIILFYQLSLIPGKEGFNRTVIVRSIIIWMFYLFFSTTIHPWYILPVIALSSLTQMRSPFIWSFLIVLSYMHYNSGVFRENYFLIVVEYLIVFIAFYIDIRKQDNS